MSIRHLKKLTQTAETQYAAAVSLEHNPATFGDAVIDISNNLNVQSANAFSAVKRAFPSAFMDATLGADPAGIRQLPDNLVHLAGLPGLQIQSLSPGSCGAPLVTGQSNDTVSFCSSTSLTSQGGVTGNGIGAPSDLDIRTVGLRTFRRGGTTDAKDCNVQPEAVDIHCRWRDRGVSTQDIYDARSIKRRVRVSEAMLA